MQKKGKPTRGVGHVARVDELEELGEHIAGEIGDLDHPR
jgi:hypothetical protein